MKKIVWIILGCLMLASAHARDEKFISVSPEPSSFAWYLRAEYNPFSKNVRDISVNKIDKNWCYANEFKTELFPPEYLQDIAEDSVHPLSFSLDAHFGQEEKLTALVGAFETCEKKKGIFLLILEQREKVKVIRFLKQFPFQHSYAALHQTDHNSIELWWCSGCNDYWELTWDAKKRKFVGRQSDR